MNAPSSPGAMAPSLAQTPSGEAPAFRPTASVQDPGARMRYFGRVSLLVFMLVTAVIAWKFHALSRTALVALEEGANAEIAHVLANELFRDRVPGGERTAPLLLRELSGIAHADLWTSRNFEQLDRTVRTMIVSTAVLKIKIYDANGITVYSTDAAQIGEDYSRQPGFIAARTGRTHSELLVRPHFSSVRGMIRNAELVQSYIPAYAPESSRVDWVFEIYSDVGPGIRLLADMHRETALWVLGLMGLLFCFVYQVVVRGEREILKRAAEREEDLRRMRSKELELEQRKSYFLAAATHELRTPMTSILGFAELLELRHFDRAQVKDLASTIRAKSQEMTYLLDDLLDLAALDEESSMAVRPVLRSIEPLIQSAVQRVTSPALDRIISLRVDPGLPDLLLDGLRFTQALANILSNACKYSPAGSEVIVEAFRDNAPGSMRIGVRITDRGTGMTRDEVGSMFKRFWRADRTSSIKGAGLGMVIVKLILDRHGASIELDSTPEVGTRVTVWLNDPAISARRPTVTA